MTPFQCFRLTLSLIAAGAVTAAAQTVLPGTQGATGIPVSMPCDGKASLGLYTPGGQLVRILAQAVSLKQGAYTARWDGMDLWGNLLPAGTPLQAKLIAGPGLKAYYEFTAGLGDTDPKDTPWLTKPVGEGLAMRTGGWMGDHTGPGAAAAYGDKVFLGSALVEYGHPLMACDLDGHKLWGGRLAGWDGPSQLFAMGTSVFARVKNSVFRLDPDTYESARLFDTATNEIQVMGAGAGKFVILLDNPASHASPFRYAVKHDDIAFNVAVPSASGDSAADFQLSGTKQFSTVFSGDGGHFQTGLAPKAQGGAWHVVVPFKKPVTFGTIVLETMDGVGSVEAYTLKAGTTYDAGRDSPVGAAGSSPLGTGLAGLDSNWELFARTGFSQRVVFLTAPAALPTTGALYLRFLPARGKSTDTQPTLALCRLLDARMVAAPAPATVSLPAGAQVRTNLPAGWDFRTPTPVNEDNAARIVIDYGQPLTCDGVLFLNNTSTRTAIDVFKGTGVPAADGEGWEQVTELKVGGGGKTGHPSASKLHRNTFAAFPTTVTTRALRLRVMGAYASGKVGMARPPDDPQRVDCDLMLPIRLLAARDTPLPQVCQVRDIAGQVLSSEPGDYGDIRLITVADDGAIYTVRGSNALCRTEFKQGAARHTPLNTTDLVTPGCLSVVRNELVLGDANRVCFLDRNGKLLRRIGTGAYARGPWDRNRLGYANGVAVDKNGKVWIAESSYSPKRISRFNQDGHCEKEFFGPPQYGGGGWLDPNLKSFYYHGMEFELDWANGTSRLKNLNDRQYTDETPAMDGSSFGYTQIGRPIYLGERRYVVGDPGVQFGPGVVVCLLDGPVWKPCAVMGSAKDNPFLVRKAVWKDHWLKQNLAGKLFIWLDRNGDGKYQVDEVEVFAKDETPGNPFDGGYWGSFIGPDLTVWSGSARLAPSGFTAQGVPLYERKNIQGFKYETLAPLYEKSQSYGSRATSGPNYQTIVCADGSLNVCGQPYRVLPDLTIAGGPVTARPSDYIPPVNGRLITQALHPAGSAVSTSAVGEVVMQVGDNGIWSLCSVRDCVMLDQIFTGSDGSWGSDLPPQRGIEVTGRRHDQETFFGHFIKAQNGKYYTVAGKGFHAISRIEGLDDFRVAATPVTVTAADFAANQKLRQQLASREKARGDNKTRGINRKFVAGPLTALTGKAAVDGSVNEWTHWEALDPQSNPNDPPSTVFFSAAYDDRGLTLAYRGATRTGNRNDDPAYLFKDGFALDVRYRIDSDKKTGDVIKGDRRIVFGKNKSRWIAVLYDYVNPDAPPGRAVDFTSPVVSTHVAAVTVLPAGEVPLVFRDNALPESNQWGFEAFLPWKLMGFDARPTRAIRFDAGIMIPDSGGITVEKRMAWADPGPLPISDVGYEAQIAPELWGTLDWK